MAQLDAPGQPPPAPPPAVALSLYRSTAGEAALRQLYDVTLASLPFPHEQQLVQTASFGQVHVVACGAPDAPPLLLWHGATTPAPFMLAPPSTLPLVERFRVYVPDIPCHAGSRSDPVMLDPDQHGHGQWCLEVAQALGLLPSPPGAGPALDAAALAAPAVSTAAVVDGLPSGGTSDGCQAPRRPPLHVGISLGGAMLLDLACIAPEAIGGAALVVPGGVPPAGTRLPASLGLTMALYRLLPCAWTLRLMLSRLFDEPDTSEPLVQNVVLGIRHVSYYPPAPVAFTDGQLRQLTAPLFLVCAERDVYGPGQATLDRAAAVWPGGQWEGMLLRGACHVPSEACMAEATKRIVEFFEARGLAG